MLLEWKRIYCLMAKCRRHVGNEAKTLKTGSERNTRKGKASQTLTAFRPFFKTLHKSDHTIAVSQRVVPKFKPITPRRYANIRGNKAEFHRVKVL